MSTYDPPYGTFTMPDSTCQIRTPWKRFSYTGDLADDTVLVDVDFPEQKPRTLGSLLGWFSNDASFVAALPAPGVTPPPMPAVR